MLLSRGSRFRVDLHSPFPRPKITQPPLQQFVLLSELSIFRFSSYSPQQSKVWSSLGIPLELSFGTLCLPGASLAVAGHSKVVQSLSRSSSSYLIQTQRLRVLWPCASPVSYKTNQNTFFIIHRMFPVARRDWLFITEPPSSTSSSKFLQTRHLGFLRPSAS